MANILYLVHRLPYPPNKGDKVRSYHLLRHLIRDNRVFLGTFIDDPEDSQYLSVLNPLCSDVKAVMLNPKQAKIRSLNGLLAGEPLTLRYYRDANLQSWVDDTIRNQKIDAIVVFCSAMAQYVEKYTRIPTVVDFVDVDSAKWTQYADQHRWPMSWIYRREGETLLSYERQVARKTSRSFFVTEAEAALFTRMAPECKVRVEAICNGVDAEFFSPAQHIASPFPSDSEAIVFTGAMDYLPNCDAVTWFAREVLPELTRQQPDRKFYIVGRSPTPEVQALASDSIIVTGTVPDVRPYLQHASVVVAPLRIARGIQNKILEAMAMEQAVVASSECAAAVNAENGTELLTASTASEFIEQVSRLLANPEQTHAIGQAARQRVVSDYSWEAHLRAIDRYISVQP